MTHSRGSKTASEDWKCADGNSVKLARIKLDAEIKFEDEKLF